MFKSWKSRIHAHYSYSSAPSFVNDHWAIHHGKSKQNPDLKVSVHIFDKKKFESALSKNGLYKKSVVNEIYDFLRLQISNLIKFKHPLLLNLLEPFEESGSKITIVSEYVSSSLNNVSDLTLSELEILKGFLQVSKALKFLNQDAKYLHLNLQPSSVLINEQNDWKLSGLGFITTIDFDSFTDYGIKSYDPRMPSFVSVNLDFSAPELSQEMRVYKNSDIWSLAALIYYVFNNGNHLLNCSNSVNYYKDEYIKFEQQLDNNSRLLFKKIPDSFHQELNKMLQRSPMMRMESIDEFIESPVFSSNQELSCLIYLDEEFPVVKDEVKLEFLTSKLLPILDSFPKDLKTNKVLKIGINLMSSKQNIMILPVIYQIIFKIGIDELSNLTFHDLILSRTYSNLSLILSYPELTLVVLSNLQQIQPKISNNEDQFIKFVKALFSKTLEPESHGSNQPPSPASVQVIMKSLDLTPLLLETLDFPFLKNTIFPKITSLFTKTTSLNIKLQTVTSLKHLTQHASKGLDKFMIKDSVLPLLKSMKARDSRILMGVVGLYECIVIEKLGYDEDLVVVEVLPKLWELSCADTLSLNDYEEFIRVINDIGGNVQRLRVDKLRKNDSTRNEVPSLPVQSPTLTNNNVQTVKPKVTPLALKPTKITEPSDQTRNSLQSLSIQSTARAQNKLLNNNINYINNDDDDEFNSFQEYTGNNNSNILQPASRPNKNGSNYNNGLFNTSTKETIDWTKESYKSQNIKLPPGFGDSLTPSVRSGGHTSSFVNNNNINQGNDGWGDSLI